MLVRKFLRTITKTTNYMEKRLNGTGMTVGKRRRKIIKTAQDMEK
jgi:hypothetical protein